MPKIKNKKKSSNVLKFSFTETLNVKTLSVNILWVTESKAFEKSNDRTLTKLQ